MRQLFCWFVMDLGLKMIIIGIDPGQTAGIAILDTESSEKLIDVFCSDFRGSIDFIKEADVVVVELPNIQRVLHKAKVLKANQKTALRVGMVLREAQLLIKFAGIHKIQCVIQSPRGKINAEAFKKLTGWNKPINQHSRDAGILAWGMRLMRVGKL